MIENRNNDRTIKVKSIINEEIIMVMTIINIGKRVVTMTIIIIIIIIIKIMTIMILKICENINKRE